MQENSQAFNPSFFLKNRHIQTLYAPLFKKDKNLDFSIERFDLEDGDFVECYWHKKEEIRENTAIIILLHGLTGSYQSPYIQGIISTLSQEGSVTVFKKAKK